MVEDLSDEDLKKQWKKEMWMNSHSQKGLIEDAQN